MGASAILKSVDFRVFAVNVKTIAPTQKLYQFGHAIWCERSEFLNYGKFLLLDLFFDAAYRGAMELYYQEKVESFRDSVRVLRDSLKFRLIVCEICNFGYCVYKLTYNKKSSISEID